MNVKNGVFALVILGLALLFLAPIIAMGFWMASPGGWMMGRGMMGWSPIGYGFGWIPMLVSPLMSLVFIGLIVLGAYYLVSGRGITEPSRDRSIEFLRERFVKGEINEEQFSEYYC